MNYKEEFLKKGYSEKSAGIFTSWMNKLQKYYSSKNIDELSLAEIRDYIDLLLTRRNLWLRNIQTIEKHILIQKPNGLKKLIT